jgi:hypothetical protein
MAISGTLPRYRITEKEEDVAVCWLSQGRAPWATPLPPVHVLPEDVPGPLMEPESAEVALEDYAP